MTRKNLISLLERRELLLPELQRQLSKAGAAFDKSGKLHGKRNLKFLNYADQQTLFRHLDDYSEVLRALIDEASMIDLYGLSIPTDEFAYKVWPMLRRAGYIDDSNSIDIEAPNGHISQLTQAERDELRRLFDASDNARGIGGTSEQIIAEAGEVNLSFASSKTSQVVNSCTHCGTQLSSIARFCRMCGQPVGDKTADPPVLTQSDIYEFMIQASLLPIITAVRERFAAELFAVPTDDEIRIAKMTSQNIVFKGRLDTIKKIHAFVDEELSNLMNSMPITADGPTPSQDPLVKEATFRYIPTETKRLVLERDRYSCVICGSTKGIQFDHIIPVSKGGDNTEHNIQILCKECNLHKSNKII